MYRQISECRICKNTQLAEVLDLGTQTLTGVFPKSRAQEVTAGPLKLVKCTGDDDVCGLLQLAAHLRSGRAVWRQLWVPLGPEREHGRAPACEGSHGFWIV